MTGKGKWTLNIVSECWDHLLLESGFCLFYNISFPKAGGLSIQKLHSKSIYLSGLLNFTNPVPVQPTKNHFEILKDQGFFFCKYQGWNSSDNYLVSDFYSTFIIFKILIIILKAKIYSTDSACYCVETLSTRESWIWRWCSVGPWKIHDTVI